MVLSMIDVTGLTNSIIVLSALCVLSLIMVCALFYRLSEHARVIKAMAERMATIEEVYIKVRHEIDTKVNPKVEVRDGKLCKVSGSKGNGKNKGKGKGSSQG